MPPGRLSYRRAARLRALFVHKENGSSGERAADGQLVRLLESSVDPVVSAVAGDLGGAVKIYILSLRKSRLPDLQMLDRHHFAAEHDDPDLLGHSVAQSLESGYNAKG